MESKRRDFLKVAGMAGAIGGITGACGSQSDGVEETRRSPATDRSKVVPGPSTPGTLTKIRDADIYRNPAYYCGPGPSPLVLRDGKVLLAFRRSVGRGHVHPEVEQCLISSEDGGATWDPEPRVFEVGVTTNPNLTWLPDNTLLFMTHPCTVIPERKYTQLKQRHGDQHIGLYYLKEYDLHALAGGIYVRRSTDWGETWSPPYWVSPVEGVRSLFPGEQSRVHLRGPALVMRDESLMLPVYTIDRPETVFLMESPHNPFASGDTYAGIRWSRRGVIARPQGRTGFNETVVYECASGKLVAFMRSSPKAGHTYTAFSTDSGRTWSEPKREDLWGYPCTVLRMPSGRVLIAYGYRRPPYGIRARLVDAECEQIGAAEELILREDGGGRDLGYPAAALLKDGTAMVTYYFNSQEDGGHQKYIAATWVREAASSVTREFGRFKPGIERS